MMRSYAILVAWLLLLQLPVLAQNPHQLVISAQGKAMAEATLTGNYEVLARYTYPKIVSMMGGKEQLIAITQQGMQQLESQGITLIDVKLGQPQQVYTAGKELHCLVPQTVVLKLNAGNMKQETYLLAVSQDQGKNWYFVDTTQLTTESTGKLFEAFNPSLKIPAPKEPVFVEK